jgi:hypothetical protein
MRGIAASFVEATRLAQTGTRSSQYGGKTTAALKSSDASASTLEMCIAMADKFPLPYPPRYAGR